MHFKSFLDEFIARGYMHQCTNLKLLETLIENNKKIVAYIGFDATAKSLHIGNLMQIMVLRLLQKYGHKPIVLIGAGTTKIGDPTGKDKMRKMLSDEQIEENMKGIKKALSKFINFASDNNFIENNSDAVILNNDIWLSQLKYIEFLRDFGSQISVNELLKRDAIKNRLEQNQSLSLLEMNYMVCQGFDFYYLNKNYNCILQIGGSDQWSNIITGVDLIKDKAIGLTTSLLIAANGEKMGKTVNGAVWLDEDMLNPFEYFQYWRNIHDADILKIANLYAELDTIKTEELKELIATNINKAKEALAFELTKLCHGIDKATEALETAKNIFNNNALNSSNNLASLMRFYISNDKINNQIMLTDILVEFEICKSKGAAKDLIISNAILINDEKVSDIKRILSIIDFIKDDDLTYFKLSVGKKKHYLICIK
ncbi:MAG: tyrosine--tRNA ligase [Rickettsiales bacterium]